MKAQTEIMRNMGIVESISRTSKWVWGIKRKVSTLSVKGRSITVYGHVPDALIGKKLLYWEKSGNISITGNHYSEVGKLFSIKDVPFLALLLSVVAGIVFILFKYYPLVVADILIVAWLASMFCCKYKRKTSLE